MSGGSFTAVLRDTEVKSQMEDEGLGRLFNV